MDVNLRPSMFDTFAKLSDGRHNMQNNNFKAGGGVVFFYNFKIFLIEDIFILSLFRSHRIRNIAVICLPIL